MPGHCGFPRVFRRSRVGTPRRPLPLGLCDLLWSPKRRGLGEVEYQKELELREQEGGSDQRGWRGLSSHLLTPGRSLWLLLTNTRSGDSCLCSERGDHRLLPKLRACPGTRGRLGKVTSKLQKEDGA